MRPENKLADPPRSKRSRDELAGWLERSIDRALAYAQTLVGNRADAEDVVHDCYSRLLAKAEQYDLVADGDKLLFKAITNASINLVQRRPPVTQLDESEIETLRPLASGSAQPQPDEQAMTRELEQAVEKALATLPIRQRAAVELKALGHNLLEIAEMLEVSHGNARVLLFRARESLAIQLQPFIKENVT